MTRTKKSALLVSVLAIVLCAAVIAGATFALFTDKSDLNIAVTSGDLDVTAQITSTATYSMGEKQEGGAFENGGKLTVDGGKVSLDRMTPGDKAVIELKIENNSDIAVKQRFIMSAGSASDSALLDQMLFGVSGKNPESYEAASFTYYSNFTSSWEEGSADGETRYITVELPEYAGSTAQGKACSFDLAVEVVQGNAVVAGDASASKVYLAEDQDALTQALKDAKNGETVVLYGSASTWNTAEIAFEGEKTVTVCGYDVGTLTVNARGGTINYYINYTQKIDKAIVADNSLHIYGEVGAAQVNVGRVVVEAGAKVESLAAIPSANSSVKVDIAENAAVEAVTVDASAQNSSTNLTVAENVVLPSLSVEGTGEVVIENKGEITDMTTGEDVTVDMTTANITTTEQLIAAIAISSKVTLGADINIGTAGSKDSGLVIKDKKVVIDFNGYTLNNVGSQIAVQVLGNSNVTFTDSSEAKDGGIYGGQGGDNQAVNIGDNSIVLFEAGYYNVGGDKNGAGNSCISIYSGSAKVTITGGTFASEKPYNGKYFVLNVQQTTGANGFFTVSGGTFIGQDPADGDDALGGSYLAEGYVSVAENHGDVIWYTVKAEGELGTDYVLNERLNSAYTGDNALKLALLDANAQDGESDTLKVSGSVNFDWGKASYDNSEALMLQNKTIEGIDDKANVTFSGYGSANPIKDAILKNITVKDKTVGDSESAWEHGYLEVENLKAENVTFANAIQLNGTSALTGCTFQGSFSQYGAWVNSGDITLTNCTFTGLRNLKIHEAYGSEVKSVTVDSCTFSDSALKAGIDFGTLNADTAVTVTNSTFNTAIYEGDTPVENFTFVEEGNTVGK